MNEPSELDGGAVRRNWSHFVQSPAQLTLSRLTKFPPGSGERIAETLNVRKNERILEVGCGMGILAGRLLESGRPDRVWGLELDDEYLSRELPSPLRPDRSPMLIRGDGFRTPLAKDSVDRVLTHTLMNLLEKDERKEFHEELRRILTPDGTVTHMDGIGGDSWVPELLVAPEPEQERRERMFDLLKSIHDRLETGFTTAVKDLPKVLDRIGLETVDVTVHGSARRVNDERWNEPQRKLLLELHQRADRDRVERLRNLLEAAGGMDEDAAQLLRQCVGDAQQQALRRRKALENNRELGWHSSSTLVVTARW